MSGRLKPNGLGELEAPIMAVLWNATGPLTVRQIRDLIPGGYDRAYTTVMTVCGILTREDKRLAKRVKRGRAWHYEAAMGYDDWAAPKIAALLEPSRNPGNLVTKAFLLLDQQREP